MEEAGVRAPWQAALALQQVGGESGYRAQLRAIVLTALGPKLTPVSPPREGVKETASASTRKRKDTPISQQSNGGSLQKALRAAAPENREESLRNLERDVFARSNHQAMDARWTTWQKLSRQWELEPLPLTTAKIRAIASSLKAGGYKSLRAYFSRVRRQHVAQCGEAAPADVDLAIRDAVRSIERGIGGPALEDGFRFEQVTLSLDSKSATKKAAIFTLGVWFLLREIELAALQVKHVAVDEANTIVTISLSCSKMDTVGQSVHRSHKCYCSYVPETRCPFHVAKALLQGAPADGEAVTTMRRCPRRRPFPSYAKFWEHQTSLSSGRSTPAASFWGQGGARLCFIILMGRWSSRAVERYVQEAHGGG